MKKLLLAFFTVFFVIIWSSIGYTQEQQNAGFHQHDGFFLRFHGGVGSGKMVEEDFLGSDMTLTGLAGVFRCQIGGTVATNLVLFGEMGAFAISDPSMEWQTISGTTENVDLSISDIGAGLTYYFMPSNIYLSSTVTLSRDRIELKDLDRAASTEMGFGIYLSVGKEWWVSSDWGLGVAGFGYYSQTTDKDENSQNEYTVNNSVFGVVFSATYH
jgi:hypothetical protein